MQRSKPGSGAWEPFDLRWGLPRIKAAVDVAVDRLGGLDALVVAGGIGAYQRAVASYYVRGKLPDEYEAQIAEMIDTNLRGPAYAIECALPYLAAEAERRDESARLSQVLVIGSVIPRSPPADLAMYAATKAALEVWVRAQARRWRSRGVALNVLATGWIETPMTEGIDPRKQREILSAIGSHRMGTMDEAADAALWLLLRAPNYFSGDVIPMTGGL